MIMHGTITVAPEFPADLEWLNTAKPIKLTDLRGKIVLVDFMAYCSINCMHILPDLKRLQDKYPNELAILGIHSARFSEERETENLRRAVWRLGIEYPVANDSRRVAWQEFGATAWPTLILIDPNGRIAGKWSGEGASKPIDDAISGLIKLYYPQGQLDRRPLKFRPEPREPRRPLLEFPGKVLADEANGQLFIADTGHNRILIAGLEDGVVRTVIGGGREGFRDGHFDDAEFNHPQGMALAGSRLFIADTGNHALRAADLKTGSVVTVAGTGGQARDLDISGAGRSTPLNSPWDLVAAGSGLFIAMAGSHQLWRMDLGTGRVEPYAGSGREGLADATLARAALAQPSGLTTDGRRLYFADSETSSVRWADLQAHPCGRPVARRRRRDDRRRRPFRLRRPRRPGAGGPPSAPAGRLLA
ncbi:MAG: thioredoxin-like domain-containing protein [Planctomycetota bacterium]|nr:thioredoxin-like domain-containing protein [Planctomycetota bacterium]